MKIVESAGNDEINRRLSETTNSQSAIQSSDLVANDPAQKLIKSALETAEDTSIFYENRRGSWQKESKSAVRKLRYQVSNGEWADSGPAQYRKISMREMAQSLQAILGSPEQAKEQIATIFKPGNSRYDTLFSDSWTDPRQIRLVADLYRYVSKTSNWLPPGCTEDEEELAALGRFYAIYCIYEYWRTSGLPFDEPETDRSVLFEGERSEQIRLDLKNQVDEPAYLVVLALDNVLRDTNNEIDGKRALLRQAAHKGKIESAFRNLVKISRAKRN